MNAPTVDEILVKMLDDSETDSPEWLRVCNALAELDKLKMHAESIETQLQFVQEAFTLKQVALADMLLFPEYFKELWEKHTGDSDEALYMCMMYKGKWKSSMFHMLSEYAPADGNLETFAKVIKDILA